MFKPLCSGPNLHALFDTHWTSPDKEGYYPLPQRLLETLEKGINSVSRNSSRLSCLNVSECVYLCVTGSESMRVIVCLVYLAPRDQRHFLVLGPNRWRGKIEMAGTSREGENWSLAFPYILQCEACFPLETQPGCAPRKHCGRVERTGRSVSVC